MTERRLCKDCRWAIDPTAQDERSLLTRRSYDWRCSHPTSLKQRPPDYVTGQTGEPYPDRCLTVRDDDARCGAEGRWWEPIDVGFGQL
jgi:hypothetical protein